MTREFGDPDTLLLPLLNSAREALEAGKTMLASGQSASQAHMMASIHLATALLKDSNFSLSSKGSQTQNDYVVDLENKTIGLNTWLFATINKRTSSFLVKISGNVETGVFTVRGGNGEEVLAEFDQNRMSKSEAFWSELSEECMRLQMSKDHFKRFGDMPTLEGDAGLRVQLPVANGMVPLTLKKKPQKEGWELIDEQTSNNLGNLPAEAATQLEQLLKALSAMVKR